MKLIRKFKNGKELYFAIKEIIPCFNDAELFLDTYSFELIWNERFIEKKFKEDGYIVLKTSMDIIEYINKII